MHINKRLFAFFFFLISITLCLHNFNEKAYSQTVLKGGIRAVIEKGSSINVNLSTPINFYFSQIGDEVAAFTREDIVIGDDYIPKGSRIEGIITNIKKPKHFGIIGAFEIDFNKIITPDNTVIPIYASITTDTSSIEKKVASILTYDSALIAYGTFHGALAGIQYGGIPLAIASHGISVFAGAGTGASLGIIGSIVRRGKVPIAITEKSTPIVLKSDFHVFGELPRREIKDQRAAVREEEYKGFRFFPALKEEDIKLTINKVKQDHSHTYGDYIVLEFSIRNNSQKKISLSDIVLLNESEITPLHADLFLSGLEALKTINPSDEITTSLAFTIWDKKDNYSVAIIDPLDKTEIVRIPLKELKARN